MLASSSSCFRRVAGSVTRRTVRSMASSASDLGFESTVVDGIKIAAKEVAGPITTLSFVIKAGSRYSTVPGVAHALQRFAFQNTKARSGFRLTRESELLGSKLSSTLGRDSIVLTAQFLNDDLPYFFEALSDVFARPTLSRHELAELVGSLLKLDSTLAQSDAVYIATEAAHAAAYRKGLGLPLYAQVSDSITAPAVVGYKDTVYTKSNLAIVVSGASASSIADLASIYLESAPAGTSSAVSVPTFFGGESRVASAAGNALVLGYAAAPSPALSVLSSILGGVPTIKWSYGSSLLAPTAGKAFAKVYPYAGSSLLTITSSGSVEDVASSSAAAVSALKTLASGVSDDLLKKGIAAAKFDVFAKYEGVSGLVAVGESLLASGEVPTMSSLAAEYSAVTAKSVKSLAESILASKVASGAVGKITELPYADELGFKA
ncbi:Metalloenzyme, LuxS/M16 peptidase-like protein [Lipomyces arxii]|uniref:Metalloenzyme, LuxS/M16 peptidase-like protein n=1 Tax=Lipomyces arxii TaxID=56418 RepID=UPI0034CF9020